MGTKLNRRLPLQWGRRLGQRHFDVSRGLTLIVTFVPETFVPLMVVAPKNHVLLPSEIATALLPGGGVVEPLDGSWLQPPITMAADMTGMMMIDVRFICLIYSKKLAKSNWKLTATAATKVMTEQNAFFMKRDAAQREPQPPRAAAAQHAN
jgi:hypothetical protein